MPIYEYECRQCGKCLEIMQKFSDTPLSTCADCGGEMKKLISNTSFVLKGSGWDVTDYASSDRKKGLDSDNKTSGKKTSGTSYETKTETKPTSVSEPKPETKSEATTEAKKETKTEAPAAK